MPGDGKRFKQGDDRKRGNGPKRGAKVGGRPPSEVAAAYRLAFDERLHVAIAIADNPKYTPMERLRALDLLGKYSGMASIQVTGADGTAFPSLLVASE